MPIRHGIQSAVGRIDTTAGIDDFAIEAANALLLTILQSDAADFLCAGGSGNAMTVPEFNSTLLGIAGLVMILAGAALLFLFGGASWAISKVKSGHGGGEGKGPALAGFALLFFGILSGSFPQIAGEFHSNAGQCFAVIAPAIESGLLLL